MSKQNQTPTSSTRGPMAVMVAGGLAVAGLVGWALTRSVEPTVAPAPTSTFVPADTASTQPTPTTTAPVTPESFSIPPKAQDPDKAVVARVSAEDLHAKFTRGEVTILDVRDAQSYQGGHIPGALNIPLASIQTQIATLPKDKPIVAYCT